MTPTSEQIQQSLGMFLESLKRPNGFELHARLNGDHLREAVRTATARREAAAVPPSRIGARR